MSARVKVEPAAVRPSAETTPAEHRMPALDGIRGIAILLVLVHHISRVLNSEFGFDNPIRSLGEFGWTGVDLFFVLSGFLITGILYDSKESGGYFKTFYARRALRIFPLYYTSLIVGLIVAARLSNLAVLGTENPAWMWVYLTNLRLAADPDGDGFGFFNHFWSLAIEEQYYLVWPTIVFFLRRRALMIAAGAAVVIALLVRVSLTGDEMSRSAYFLTFARMDTLAAGSLIALAIRGPLGIKVFVRPAALIGICASVALTAIIVTGHTVDPTHAVMGTAGYSLIAVFFACMLILSLTWRPLTSVTSLPVLRWLGKYSYGLYVWQTPVFWLLFYTDLGRGLRGAHTPFDAVLSISAAVALSIAIALLSWHVLEKRFLSLKRFFGHQPPRKVTSRVAPAAAEVSAAPAPVIKQVPHAKP